MNPKLLYVFYTLNAGGAESSAITVANYLAKNKNFNISFYVFNDGKTLKDEISPKINIIQSDKIISNNSIIARLQNYLQFGFLLSKSIKHKNFDLVIAVHEHLPEFALIIWKLLNPLSTIKNNLVLNLHFSPRQLLNTRGSTITILFHKYLIKKRKKTFTHIFTISDSIKKELSNIDHEKITTIYNPIDMEFLQKCAQSPSEITIDKKYFVTVGTISKRKDQLWVLKALHEFIVTNSYKLVFIGRVLEENIYKEMLSYIEENYLQESIIITGEIKNPYNLISNAKALISTSSYESFGYVQHEAMLLKVPVITVRLEETKEFYNDAKCFLFNQYDKNELIKSLEMIHDKNPKVEMKIMNAEEYLKSFDIHEICGKYVKSYLKIIKPNE